MGSPPVFRVGVHGAVFGVDPDGGRAALARRLGADAAVAGDGAARAQPPDGPAGRRGSRVMIRWAGVAGGGRRGR